MNRTEHREKNWKFPFVKYTPSSYETDSGKKLPLIIQLHGAGERGYGDDDLSLVDVHGFSKIIKDKDYECMIIMPQCAPETFWAARVESVIEFIGQIKDAFSIDEGRVYLTGLSMGGYGTWYTAMARPDIFAAIAPCCGGGMAWNAGRLKMPVWVFHGSDDTTVSPVQSDEMVEAIRANGGNVRYSRIDGVGHAVQEYAFTDELIKWLLSNTR